jgi:hypothetical protein
MFMPYLIVQEVRVDITDRVRIWSCGDAGDEGVVVGGKTLQQVRDEFFIFNALADGCQCVSEPFYLSEVISDGEISFLDGGEMHPYLHDTCTRA